MSFGWSVGDIINAAELLWKVSKALKDAEGARNQFQQTVALLKPIQSQLRQLARVLDKCESRSITGEKSSDSACFEEADLDTIQGVLARLKTLVAKLESALEEGCRMRLENPKSKSLREWPRDQLNKLKWSFVKDKKIQIFLVDIRNLTDSLPGFYREIDLEFARSQANIQRTTSEKQFAILNSIFQKIEALPQALLALNAQQKGAILRIGPEEGLLPPKEQTKVKGVVEISIVPTLREAFSNLEMVSYNIMSPKASRRAAIVKTDHVVKNTLVSWLEGTSPSILWLSGKEATTVSAVVAKVAQERGRPCVAVSNCAGKSSKSDLCVEERLLGMMYSILYQLLQEIDGCTLISMDQSKSSQDLDASMKSLPLALSYIRDIISLVPQCVVVVDAWHFVEIGSDPVVEGLLVDFLEVFGGAKKKQEDEYGGRLLITSLGPSKMLKDFGKQFAENLNVTGHVDKGLLSLSTQLSSIEW